MCYGWEMKHRNAERKCDLRSKSWNEATEEMTDSWQRRREGRRNAAGCEAEKAEKAEEGTIGCINLTLKWHSTCGLRRLAKLAYETSCVWPSPCSQYYFFYEEKRNMHSELSRPICHAMTIWNTNEATENDAWRRRRETVQYIPSESY